MGFHKMFTLTGKAICLTGIAALALLYVEFRHPPERWTAQSTAVGEVRHLVLQDGSKVDLNTASEIRVCVGEQGRKITLTRGEARFYVGSGDPGPLIVSAAGARFQAAGADFSVRLLNGSQLEVLVKTGHVQITVPDSQSKLLNLFSSSAPLIVYAGEVLSLRSNATYVKEELSPTTLERKTAWTDGWIWFFKDPLPEAVAQFNRYHEQQLVLVDPRLAHLEVGGRFRSTDLDSFIATLEHSFDVQATTAPVHGTTSRGTGGGTIYLTSRCVRAQQQCNWPMVQ
jgi:transmembrane sensor